MSNCPFCAIATGKAPAKVVRWWPDAVAIVPLNPVTDGHVLIIPRVHVEDVGEDAVVTATVMARAVEFMGNLGDLNLITSRGAAATQTVFHLHVHLVPRHPGDGLPLPWTPQQREATKIGMSKIRSCPHNGLFVRNTDTGRWQAWSPNGEYWEDECGDDLTDTQVADWPEKL